MANSQTGTDALTALYETDEGTSNSFATFKSGTEYVVKVLGTADISQFFNYGIFDKKVSSFVAKNPSKKSAKGNPVEDLTPFDLAWKYHADKSEEFGDTHSTEAYKYKPKMRFAMGFFDLDSGEQIVIDVSKNQAQAIHGSIKKNENKLNKKAFTLSKEGKGQSTVVTLMPEDLEDLSDEQRKNFDNTPSEFDTSLFEGLSYEADEAEQLQKLQQAGFDITLIGYSQEDVKQSENGDESSPLESDVGQPDLPF